MILTLRTDQPRAELGLYDKDQQLAELKWQADRQLSDGLLGKIEELLKQQQADLTNLTGLVVFEGPGSFTGLRIGHTVANTLAYSLDIPIVTTDGDDWITTGLAKLAAGDNAKVILPAYGHAANITKPKK